jgi:DNA-binding HxlR family transcriptional regulator
MALLDLLGRRWTLRILWELREGPLGFRPLQAACDQMSPTVLATRLGELRSVGLIDTDAVGMNQLSALGTDLTEALGPLQTFAGSWAAALTSAAPASDAAAPGASPANLRPKKSL